MKKKEERYESGYKSGRVAVFCERRLRFVVYLSPSWLWISWSFIWKLH